MDLTDQLDCLLNDICEFLKTQETNTALSPADRRKSQSLIDRSKKHLEKIAVLKDDFLTDEPNTVRYVTMTGKQPIIDKPPPLPSPNPVIQPSSKTSLQSFQIKCPFKDLSAESFLKMKTGSKHGVLSLRKKFTLLTCSTKIFGAIHENWLLIYSSSISNKPFRTIDLKEYVAKEDVCDSKMIELANSKEEKSKNNGTKMAWFFKVTNLPSQNKREYHFGASTYKDMRQWVFNINTSHDQALKTIEDEYDIVVATLDNDEDNIYDKVDVQKPLKYPPQRRVPSPPISRSSSSQMLYQEIGSVEKALSDEQDMKDCDEYYDVIVTRKKMDDLENETLSEEPLEESNYENGTNIPLTTKSIRESSIKNVLEEVEANKLTSNRSTLHSRLSTNQPSNVKIKIQQKDVQKDVPSSINLETFSPNSKLDASISSQESALLHITPPTATMINESLKRLKSVCRESQENIEKTTKPTKVAKKLEF